MSIIQEHLGEHSSPSVPLNVDATAFPLDIASLRDQFNPAVMDNLPSFDYAIYLTNTVKFHVTQTYHLFEETNFTQTLNLIYNQEAQSLDPQRRLEYIQYFIIMALGKALLGRVGTKSQPPGSEYFMRAMELFPDISGLYRDPFLAVEICCGLALYLQAIDHRNSAYVYVSSSSRLYSTILTVPSLDSPCVCLSVKDYIAIYLADIAMRLKDSDTVALGGHSTSWTGSSRH